MVILNSGDSYSLASNEKVIFLAGPTKRREKSSKEITNWRTEALKYFKRHEDKTNHSLIIVIPEPFIEDENVDSQIAWEQKWLKKADKILFWVARDHASGMHATVTNLEYGKFIDEGPSKVTYGRPDGADSSSSNDWHARQNDVPIFDDLEKLIQHTIIH